MPYLNTFGQVAHGKGGMGAYYNNAQFDTGGLACWYDSRYIAYQHGAADGEYVSLYDTQLNTMVRAIISPGHPFYGWGVNTLYAGGGVWAGWAHVTGRGLFASTGLHLQAAGLVGVGPDGAIGFVPDYLADAPVHVREQDGNIWVLSQTPVLQLQLLGNYRAIWQAGQVIGVKNIPMPVVVPGGVWTPRAVKLGNQWWVLYWSGSNRTVLHPFDSTVGYVIADSAWIDAVVIGVDVIRVVWSVTEGEGAGDIRFRDVNVNVEPREELGEGGGELPPPEEDVKPPKITVQTWTLDELLDGREFVFEETNNPELGYKARVSVRDGGMYAEFWNKAGYATTGVKRPVKPCPEIEEPVDPEEPEKPPPVPKTSTVVTDWKTVWHVAPNGRIGHTDSADERATLFTPERLENGRYAFKAPNGKYVCAEGGGAEDYLIANRDAPGGWEQFTKGPTGSNDRPAGFTLQADNGKYVSAEKDGRLTTHKDAGGGWETFESEAMMAGGTGTTPRLTVDHIYFRREDGERFHAIECSDFSLYKWFLEGRDLGAVLSQRSDLGFNMLRVWLLNTSVIPGGLEPDQYINFYQYLPEFLRVCSSYGQYVELTAFTQTQTLMPDSADQIAHLNRVVEAVRNEPNVLIELVNEGDQHDNATSATFSRPHGVLASTGSNGADSAPPMPDWDYVLYHTNDLNEWQRKTGHNAMEWGVVRGVPCISNENTRFADKDADLDHAYDAAAGAALLCAGACFHSQAGKVSQLWGGHELECAKAWVAGARSVPLEFQPGAYARHDDLNGPDCIRAYSRTLGDGRSWLVKIRP